jgi:oligopeptide/dipeptide ABC transporter ATP-binding protein
VIPTLEIRDLAVRFATEGGAVHAVRGVSLAVQPGHVVGIVGESGSGKSATCRAALGLLPPNATTSGAAWFEGRDLMALTQRELQRIRGRRIGWVFQDPMSSLNPVRSIGDQLGEAVVVHERIGRRELRLRILSALSDVGFPASERRLGAFPHELSGGLRQRVMIAMAMINRPALLIADEPTSALDVTTQAQILELLRDLTKTTATSVILITHDLGVVDRVCDEFVVMYAGRVVEEGRTRELFARPAHPYAWGLMRSLPSLAVGGRLRPIPGGPPRLDHEPPGCAFAPRCETALERCFVVDPPLEAEGDEATHRFACHLDAATRHREAGVIANAVAVASSQTGATV